MNTFTKLLNFPGWTPPFNTSKQEKSAAHRAVSPVNVTEIYLQMVVEEQRRLVMEAWEHQTGFNSSPR